MPKCDKDAYTIWALTLVPLPSLCALIQIYAYAQTLIMTNMSRSTEHATLLPPTYNPPTTWYPLLLWWPIISVVLFVCRRFVRPRSVDENPKINKSCIISLVELGSGGADGTMDVTGFLAPFRRPLMTRTQSLK